MPHSVLTNKTMMTMTTAMMIMAYTKFGDRLYCHEEKRDANNKYNFNVLAGKRNYYREQERFCPWVQLRFTRNTRRYIN